MGTLQAVSAEPPSSNTGAQNTQPQNSSTPEFSRRAILDWCSGTLPIDCRELQEVELVIRQLGLNWSDVRELNKGQNGYRRGVTAGLARVYYDGNPGMGVHFVLSGKACREFEDHHGEGCWKGLQRAVERAEGHFTRVDVAIDDTTGALDLGTVQEAPARSYWKQSQVTVGRDITTGESLGHTLYFGSRKSNAFARFYDKAAEQGVSYPWVRVELELKKDHADSVMRMISYEAPLGKLVAGILRHYLTFLEPNPGDSNRARWDVAAWWESWLGQVERLSLTMAKQVIKTIDELKTIIKRQWGPTFAAMWHGAGRDLQELGHFLRELVQDGLPRMKERHWAMLQPAPL